MKSIALAAALAVMIPGAAVAADLPSGKGFFDAPVRAESFTGIYFSAVGGPDFANTKISGGNASFRGIGSDGLFGEAQIGYDKQIGNFVIGAFGGLNISNTDTVLEFGGTEVAKLHKDWSWLVGVRFGYVIHNTMIYAAGGYTQTDASLDFLGTEVGNDTIHGGFGEVGMETRLGHSNVYGKVAARYTKYVTESYDGIDINPSDVQALVGLTVRFGQ